MKRRLAAILAADVVGYSRLMGEDEAGTLAAITAHRKELIDPKVRQYNGRTVKLMGDGALMEFASAVDAVAFAVDVQEAMAECNQEVPEKRRIIYRIGINIGDIIVEGDDIYGDGVNVAARLEEREPGGVCIARNVFNQVQGKLDLTFEQLGEKAVKNIAKPVSVYRINLDDKAAALVTPVAQKAVKPDRRWRPVATAAAAVLVLALGGAFWWQPWAPDVESASVERMALPDKPSIAVLAFDNLSGDPRQDYFSDGLSENVITELSRFTDLFVIARNSSFQYKGKNVDVRQIGRELGVRYILEGSVQRSSDQVRVTVQLINAVSGGHVWSERYDRPLTDLFEIQDDLTRQIAAAVGTAYGGAIPRVEVGQDTEEASKRFQAYDLLLRGINSIEKFTKEDIQQGREFLLKAVELDPDYAKAYAKLAISYFLDYAVIGASKGKDALPQVTRYARLAVEADRTEPWAYWAQAYSHLYSQENHDAALQDFEKALAFNPNDADILSEYGWTLCWAGRAEDGLQHVQEAMRLNPHYPDWYLNNLATCYVLLRDHKNVIATIARKSQQLDDKRAYLAASYARTGQMDKAKEQVRVLLEKDPDLTIGRYVATRRFKRSEDRDYFAKSLELAGLPK